MNENRGYQGKRLQPKKRAAKFWSDYGYLLVTVAVVFVLFKVVFQLAFVPTGSMETTVPSKSLMSAGVCRMLCPTRYPSAARS